MIVNGEVVDTIYLDFAFDTVPHRRLLHKLAPCSIKGIIQRWISAFLNDRSQVVAQSKSAPSLSRIPQGSVLDPLLFMNYINDLLEVGSDVFLFADDTKVLHQVSSTEDDITLQHDLDSFERWFNDWLLKSNVVKCHTLTLAKFENILYTHRYQICGNEFDHVFEEKDSAWPTKEYGLVCFERLNIRGWWKEKPLKCKHLMINFL